MSVDAGADNGRPIGFGRLRRKEDARFIRGQGRFVDDVQLAGMLHGAILRSPLAHARIVSIDAMRACASGLRRIAPAVIPVSCTSST